jgi:hypothetical protein
MFQSIEGVFGIDELEARRDFEKLKASDAVMAGMKTVKHFMFAHTCHVKVRSNGRMREPFVSFIDFMDNLDQLRENYFYIDQAIVLSKSRHQHRPHLYHCYDAFRLYFGTVSIFKPSIAKRIVDIFQPSIVYDPCCGWGGRMLGAVTGGCDLYVGVDTNQKIVDSHLKMIEFLGIQDKAKITFGDCVTHNPGTYDMLLTSPPYYNTEVYEGSIVRNNDEWATWYRVVFHKWWQGLSIGGVMALSISHSIYRIAKEVCGSADDSWTINTPRRFAEGDETERLYIWIKT